MLRLYKLWKKAKRRTRPHISKEDYILIAVSASASSAVYSLFSKMDINSNPLTGYYMVDFFLYIILLGFFVIFVINLFFKTLEYLYAFWMFLWFLIKK